MPSRVRRTSSNLDQSSTRNSTNLPLRKPQSPPIPIWNPYYHLHTTPNLSDLVRSKWNPIQLRRTYQFQHLKRHPNTLNPPYSKMSYFRVQLLRSAIGLPRRSTDVLKALGLKKRMGIVFHRVSPSVAGQIMKVKELVSVQEVDRALTQQEVRLERKPDPGYYVEKSGVAERAELSGQ
ncbi:uncharacterized protein N7473_005864 [Penicillium subrubescens]|nr:uncharacterized protein N7473_005864 [Penicillium subrubescens]KAJ5896465.1 hypothetical protein N7473_005864 [Penicillium subrubescens]